MGGDSSYIAILRVAGFLGAAWGATKLSRIVGISSIVGEIAVGVALGPHLVGLMPAEYAECQHKTYMDCVEPEGFDGGYGELGYLQHFTGACHREDYEHSGDRADRHEGPRPQTDADGEGPQRRLEEEDGEGPQRRLEECQALLEDHGMTPPPAGSRKSRAEDPRQTRRLSGSSSYDSYGGCLVGECEHEQNKRCQLTPDIFTLIGQTGVAMMIFESGMHFDFSMAAQVGPLACVVAVIGTLLPLAAGAALCYADGRPIMPVGISAGMALAPTSVGISLRLLGEAKVLNQPFGQTIMTAAFVDDILSLILFNILFDLGDGGDITFMRTFFWSVMGVAFMIVATILAVKFWPCAISRVWLPFAERLARWSSDEPNPKVPYKDQALFVLMLVLLLGYATITFVCGTHLWGCFIAGMSFACLEPHGHAHHVWVNQTKRLTSWMIRIFFSCTVAFSIPVDTLISVEALWKGAIMGVGPCILTKVSCALFMGPPRWVIGWAMVGRAEFAYLIAQMASSAGMLDENTFSIVIWALLWATIVAPLVFRFVLNRYIRSHNIQTGETTPHQQRLGPEDEEHAGFKEAIGSLAPPIGKEPNGHWNGSKEALRGVAFEDDMRQQIVAELEGTLVLEKGPVKEVFGAGNGGTEAGQPVEAPAPWEEVAIAPPEVEREMMPLTSNGKGVLCCLFFNKVTMVKPPGT